MVGLAWVEKALGRMGKYGDLLRNIVIFGLGTFLAKLVQFCLLPLYTSYLSTEAYAAGELLNNFVDLAYPVLTLSLYQAVFRFALSGTWQDSKLLSCAIREHLVASLLVLVASVVGFVVTSSYLAIGFALLFFVSSLRQILAFYARGAGYSMEFAVSGVMNAVALALSSWIFIVMLRLGSVGYVLGLVVGYLVSCAFILLCTNAKSCIHPFADYDAGVNREMLRYSLPLIGADIAFWVSTMSGRYVLAWIVGAGAAGLFLAVSKLSAAVNMIQQVFFYAFQINSSLEYERNADEAFLSKTYWLFSAGLTLACSLLICVLPLISGFILQGEFSTASIYLPLTLFAAYIDCLFCYFKSFYTSFKQTNRAMISTSVGAVVNLAFCFVLIPSFGIWGALFSVLLSNVSVGLIRAVDTRRLIAIDQRWRTNGPALALFGAQVVLLSLLGVSAVPAAAAIFFGIAAIYSFAYRKTLRRCFNALAGRIKK